MLSANVCPRMLSEPLDTCDNRLTVTESSVKEYLLGNGGDKVRRAATNPASALVTEIKASIASTYHTITVNFVRHCRGWSGSRRALCTCRLCIQAIPGRGLNATERAASGGVHVLRLPPPRVHLIR